MVSSNIQIIKALKNSILYNSSKSQMPKKKKEYKISNIKNQNYLKFLFSYVFVKKIIQYTKRDQCPCYCLPRHKVLWI